MFALDRLRRRHWPIASMALGAFTLALFAVEIAYGGGHAEHVLRELGGTSRELTVQGRGWQRLLAAAFLHVNVVHLAANGWSFAVLAPLVERLFGASRLAIVYVLAAIGGNALSAAANLSPLTVGASGAIFGLVGFLGAAATGGRSHEMRVVVRSILGRSLFVWAAYVLANGFLPASRVDNLAHLGGLATGAVLGLALAGDRPAPRGQRLLAVVLALAIPASFASGWLEARGRDVEQDAIHDIMDAVATKKWDRAVHLCEEALVDRPRSLRVPEVLFWQGVAFRKEDRPEDARLALERSYRLRPHVLPAYFLAAIAIARSDTKTALDWAERGDAFGDKPALKIHVAEQLLDAGLPDAALVALERARATGTLDIVDRHRVAAIESAARARR